MAESTKRYTLLAANREHAETVARQAVERDHPGKNPDDLFDIHVSPLLPPDEVYTVDNEEMRRDEERWKSMMYAPPAGPLTAEALADQIVEEGRRMRQRVIDGWMSRMSAEAPAPEQPSDPSYINPTRCMEPESNRHFPADIAGHAANLCGDSSVPDLTGWFADYDQRNGAR